MCTFPLLLLHRTGERATAKIIYHKGDYDSMRREAASMNWSMTQSGVETSWRSLTNNLKTFMDKYIKYIPKTKPHITGKMRPPHMTQRAIEKVKEKNKLFKTWSNKRGHGLQQICKGTEPSQVGVP